MHSFARSSLLTGIALAAAAVSYAARADDLGWYAGGAIGYSTQYIDAVSGGAEQHDTGWKVIAGIRPIPWLGAEAEYFDLGSPSRMIAALNVSAKSSGEAAFGVLYLPYGIGDLFVKAGGASVTARALVVAGPVGGGGANTLYYTDQTNVVAAWGGGGQIKFDNLGVRLEYEGFNAPTGRQGLISAGVLWTF
ncbi:MAG: hypothetical protein ABSE43_00690 [Steroidobacteraceae bacterium]|jgi:hypothetical protein